MPHFAYCPDGVVRKVERVESAVMRDESGKESEALGQAFLASCYPGTDPSHYVMTYYPINQPTPYPRGKYAGFGDRWDGVNFIPGVTDAVTEEL